VKLQAGRVSVFARHAQFAGDRDAVRRQAAALGLRMLGEP
jgi:hypothetical protein